MPARRSARRPALATVALVASILGVAGACSSPGDAPPVTTVPPRPGGVGRFGTTVPGTVPPGSTPTGSTPAGTATISRFDVPASVTCPPGGEATVPAEIATDAVSVRITVDNRALPDAPPTTGSFSIPLPCDGSAHTIVLVALDGANHATILSRAVLADDQRDG